MKVATSPLICFYAICGVVGADPGTDKDRGRAELGRLGFPLGKIVEIQATVRAGSGEEYLLDLTSIEGVGLPSPDGMGFRVVPMASGYGLVADRATLAKVWRGKEIDEVEKNYVGKKFRLLVEESRGFKSTLEGFGDGLPKISLATTGLVVWRVLATNADAKATDRDPNQIRWSAKLTNEQWRDRDLLRLVGAWFKKSPKQVSAELKDLRPSPTRDAGITIFCRCISGEDPQGAQLWAGEISDPKLRKSVLDELKRAK